MKEATQMTTHKGIRCFGEMSETATVSMVGTWDKDCEELDQMYLGSQGFTTWEQLADYVHAASEEEGYTIHEMESDE
jgi:hypothetical protein